MLDSLDINKYVDDVTAEEEKSDMHYSIYSIPSAYKPDEDELQELINTSLNNGETWNIKQKQS